MKTKSKANMKLSKTWVSNEQNQLRLLRLKPSIPQRRQKLDRLALLHAHGIKLIDCNNILFIKADGNYSEVHTSDQQRYIATKTLKHFADGLQESGFIRCHQSYLINTRHIDSVVADEENKIWLSNGQRIPLSRRRYADIKKYLLQQYAI